MVRLLDKSLEMGMLEELFELLWRNMMPVIPWEHSYETEKANWLSCVGPAMEKNPRQIALVLDGEMPVGFCMFYCSNEVFMVEELQLLPEYRGGSRTVSLWKFLKRQLPDGVRYMEAYADRRNIPSQKLMEKIGMEPVEQGRNFLRFRGEIRRIPIFAEPPGSAPRQV